MSGTATAAAQARVLLVEDDASIRHFVSLALEEHAVQLVSCPSLATAREALRAGPVLLVLLDMMLPDGSGLELLRDRALRASAPGTRWVVFSAGLSPAVKDEVPRLAVDRVLQKPVALAALLDCVDDALRAGAPPGAPEPAPAVTASAAAVTTPGAGGGVAPAVDGSPEAEAQAIHEFFEGDATLFALMKQRAQSQFLRDLETGDAAMAAADLHALRRVAHSLKTVLRMLGWPEAGARARQLEDALAADDLGRWAPLWAQLRQRVQDAARR